MIKSWTTKRPAVPSMALSVAFLVWSSVSASALSICTTAACDRGYQACVDWCDAHNKYNASLSLCKVRCGDYWHDDRSSIGRPNPTSGPPGVVTPIPPTTVGPPARKVPPVRPVRPVGVSNPNQTGSGSVILLREHSESGGQGHGH